MKSGTKASEHFTGNYSFFELAPVAMWIVDLKSSAFLKVNQAAVAQYGYTAEEFLSMGLDDLLPEDDVQDGEKPLSEANQQYLRHRRKDGELIYVKTHHNNITYGGKHAALISATEITEKHPSEANGPAIKDLVGDNAELRDVAAKEEEARIASERYRIASTASQDHIYDWNLVNDKVTRLGESLEKLFGYSSQDPDVSNREFWASKVHPDEKEMIYNDLEHVLKDPTKDKLVQQYRFRRTDGSYATVIDTAQVLRDPSGKAIHLIGAVRNISELVQRQQEEKLLLSLANAIGQPGRLEECLYAGLGEMLSFPSVSSCEIWLTSIDQNQLNLVTFTFKNDRMIGFYDSFAERTSIKMGEGIAGHVWKNRAAEIWEVNEHEGFLYRRQALGVGIQSALGIPIIYRDKFLGVLVLLSVKEGRELKPLKGLLHQLGGRIGPVLQQKVTEDELSSFFRVSPDLLCIIGFDGYFKKANRAVEDVLGYSREYLLSKPVEYFVYPADREIAREHLVLLGQKGTEARFQVRFLTRSGDVKWLNWSAGQRREEKLIFGVGKDITEQKQAEIELTEAYNRLKNAQRIAKLGYWSRGVGQTVAEWSDEVFILLGYEPQSFVPGYQKYKERVHPDDLHLFPKDFAEELADKGRVEFQHRLITVQGEVRWADQRIKLRLDRQGQPYLLEGTVQDITTQRKYEQQLELSKERFELAMKATNEMIWDWDHTTNEIHRGSGYENAFDYEAFDIGSTSNSWFSRIHPNDRQEVWEAVQTTLNDGEASGWHKDYRMIKPNGSVAHITDRAYIIRDANGKALRSIGAALDITETRNQLLEIQKQNKALREIAWMQSHVVRAPLARIMGLIHILEDDGFDQVSQGKREILQHILEASHELDDVIREIVDKSAGIEKQA